MLVQRGWELWVGDFAGRWGIHGPAQGVQMSAVPCGTVGGDNLLLGEMKLMSWVHPWAGAVGPQPLT